MVFQSQPVHEWLRYRLNRKKLLAITDFEHLSVGCGNRNAEPAAVGFGQLGDVVGDLAFVERSIASMQLAEYIAKWRRGSFHFADQQIDFVMRCGSRHGSHFKDGLGL